MQWTFSSRGNLLTHRQRLYENGRHATLSLTLWWAFISEEKVGANCSSGQTFGRKGGIDAEVEKQL
jgi:hypothetical protein